MPWIAGGGRTRACPSGRFDQRGGQPLVDREQVLSLGLEPLVEWLEHDPGGAGVEQVGAVVEQGHAGDADHPLDARNFPGDVRGPGQGLAGAPHGGAFGQLERDQQIALVVDRNEGGGNAGQAPDAKAGNDERDDDHQSAAMDHLADEIGVAPLHRVVSGIEGAEEEIALFRRDRRAQPQRALGRLEGRGVEGGNQRGGGDHQRELREHVAGEAGHEGRGQEHRHQHQGDADDGAEQFVHRLDRGRDAGHALFDIFGHALDDDDGVVHDNADGEHDAEQGREVDGEAERRHGGEGADDRDRNRGRRHEGGAEILQEGQDHHQDENAGLVERLVDFRDRVPHKDRGVVGNGILQPLGEALGHPVHQGFDFLADLERVGIRRLIDGDARRRLAVQAEFLGIGLRAELDAGDVAEMDQPAALGGLVLDDDIAELRGLVEARLDVDGVLELDIPGRGRRAGLAGGDVLVLLADRADDVLGFEPEAVQLAGVHPDAHGVIAGADDPDAADAGQTGERVDEVDRRVIAQEKRVIFVVGRIQHHELQDRGVLLLDVDALRLDRFGQRGQGELDAVLHQNLVDIRIGADGEGDGQHISAVRRARRLHIEHLVDAVDLVLDRQRDGVQHGLGAGAGIARRDLNRRRDHVGIFGDGQAVERHRADDDEHDRQHIGQNRTLDEKFGHHRLFSRCGFGGRAKGLRRFGRQFRGDRHAGRCAPELADHHTVGAVEAALDRLQRADRFAELDITLLDDIAVVDIRR